MNISTLVNFLFAVALSTSIEVSAQIRVNNGVEIQDMVVRILDHTKLLMFGPKVSQKSFDRHLFHSSFVLRF